MKVEFIHIPRCIRPAGLLGLLGCLAMCMFAACTDDEFMERENPLNPNAITFQVTSGITATQTRAATDTTDLLEPQVLTNAEGDFTLYLHRYVADESERATGVSAETRSLQINDVASFYELNKGNGFGVKSVYLNNDATAEVSDFISLTVATPYQDNNQSTDIWSFTPVRYWPNKDPMLRFYAYAPETAKSLLRNLTMEDGTIAFDYTVPTAASTTDGYRGDAEAQPDLMFATTVGSKTSDNVIAAENKVPLNFRHALSSIKFAVRDISKGSIKSIAIKGVDGSAHCVFQHDANSETGSFAWTNNADDTSAEYCQTFNFPITEDKYYENPSQDSGADDLALYEGANGMPQKTFMLIPQDVPADAVLEITIIRDNAPDGDKELVISGLLNNPALDENRRITKWEPGKEYIYTISTNKSNWVYVFDVIGVDQEDNDENPLDGDFVPSREYLRVNYSVEEGASYKVQSYRWPANHMVEEAKEIVSWSIAPFKGDNHLPTSNNLNPDLVNKIDRMQITSDYWLGLQEGHYNQPGSIDHTEYEVVFYPQMVTTDWQGDWILQARNPLGSAQKPIDLSMVYDKRNTANCYVINASGYYKLPLVYGNLITDGVEDELLSSCVSHSKGTPTNNSLYPVLPEYVDYKGNKIPSVWIDGADDAILIWQDAYNLISNVTLSEDKKFISFTVNREHLQQGNAVLAVRDKDDVIIWSWHIWITEYWTEEGNLQLGVDDVTCNAYDDGYGTFTVAPRSLGWCDAKNEWYLKRTGTMEFTQGISGKRVQLKVEQREKVVEYWIGNNVYYQFGRKDPFVGFRGTSSKVKYNFGEYPYRLEPQTKTIEDGIKNPNIMYVGAAPSTATDRTSNDWLTISYCNLWNNTSITFAEADPSGKNTVDPDTKLIVPYHYSGVKTIYDPCPVGYQVPPVGFFRFFTPLRESAKDITKDELNSRDDEFNGVIDEAIPPKGESSKYKYFKWYTPVGDQTILFTTTGHRWYASSSPGPGNNFNPQVVYLWSNQVRFFTTDRCAFGLALGHVGNDAKTGVDEFAISFRFEGRRAMARPVRPVKFFNDQAFTAK